MGEKIEDIEKLKLEELKDIKKELQDIKCILGSRFLAKYKTTFANHVRHVEPLDYETQLEDLRKSFCID